MLYSLLLEMDQDTEYENLSEDKQNAIQLLNARWLDHITPGTETVSTKKVMHCVIESDTSDVETLVNSLIVTYGVNWTVLGIQSFKAIEPVVVGEEITGYQAQVFVPLNTSAILDYIQSRGAQVKDISWLHTFAGQAPWRTV